MMLTAPERCVSSVPAEYQGTVRILRPFIAGLVRLTAAGFSGEHPSLTGRVSRTQAVSPGRLDFFPACRRPPCAR